ncbi:hypothetical protein BJ508DRAFT_211467 [Ascobolus immersus RN42]|uniref:PH domain-containing protein n=1 Tax=Ascobolus immersus RN42 TaxID=1160509 RepID=A0A3N4I145_ASCIM|nr:hypothetical protein BJ508DRAFT_211467 [Ascobolus immersus RN42]
MVRFNTHGDEAGPPIVTEPVALKKRRSLRKANKHTQGEILKISKMLIRIEVTRADLTDDFDENEAAALQTRVLEKWKEYVVVCRDAGDQEEDVEVKLQLYSNRKIPAKDTKGSWMVLGGGPAKEIMLNRRNTRVNMYSTLDKTLVIYHPHKLGNVFYVLRPDNMAKSVEWYTFLQDRLGVTRPESLDVSVPDLNLVLRLDRPFKELKREVTAVEDDEGGDEEVVVTKVLDHAARSLIVRSLALLKEGSEWTEVLNYWQRNERMGLAWRRYDRIEWIFGENETKMYGTLAMQKTHELELRPKVHYPTEVQLEGKEVLEEPPPIEGFLVRLSTATGKSTRFGRIFFRRHYFYSQNHLLFFCKPAAAIPPPPPHLVSAEEMPEAEEIAEKTPLIYAVTPYALDEEGEIPWLSSTSSKEVHEKDHAAFTEGQRNVRNAIAADGFIDIRKIKMIKLVLKTQLGDTAEAVEEEGGWTGEDPHPDHIEDNLFDIILTNGLTLRLQAFNSATRDEWMTRLKALSLYWSARSLADSRELMSVRASNLRLHGCDEQSEYLLSQASRKWEVHNSLASPLLHTFCGISSCRTITHAGPLYLKARKHSTFRKVHAVLVHGNLLLYEANYRHPLSGVALPALAQMKHSTHPLQHVYLLSNLLTSASLLPSTTGGSATTTTTAGKPYTPRVYDDGVTSSDTDEQLAFCLWVAPQRVLVGDGKGGVKRVGALGREGSVKIFKARTRAERDMWVGALAVEIERGRGEEEWGIKGAEEDGMGMQRADTGIGGGGEEI